MDILGDTMTKEEVGGLGVTQKALCMDYILSITALLMYTIQTIVICSLKPIK